MKKSKIVLLSIVILVILILGIYLGAYLHPDYRIEGLKIYGYHPDDIDGPDSVIYTHEEWEEWGIEVEKKKNK